MVAAIGPGMGEMAHSAALGKLLLLEEAARQTDASVAGTSFDVSVSHSLAEVEVVWRGLTAGAIESPGQTIDFIRLWTDALGIPEANQFYVVAHDEGVPVALMPLQRRWDKGVRVLSWFPGVHVGCDAPIVDVARVAAMNPARRRRLWIEMLRGAGGADLVYLKSIPQLVVDGVDLFADLGQWIEAETLYRVSFSSFEDADKTQRNKSRRKHDRQQGDKLEAMGTVSFEEISNGVPALAVLDTMFRQRAARFREMGVFDPFAVPAIRAFYDSTAAEHSGLPVKLHVLRLDGEIVATRYNVVHGDRLFCLISSMSEAPELRPGSPGKQCLLRVMQTMFDAGFRVFDMGEGLTDEKRHWCNQQIPVRHHYVPITRRGALAASAHRRWQVTRAQIKADPRLLEMAKRARGVMARLKGKGGSAAPAAED
jgi:CelD/BcsL family acetyltransferase involved in cellulose biosynthesis